MKRWWWTWCAVLAAGACTQDNPTEAGSGLLPPDAIRTFEVVLPAERYLQWDTAFGLYSDPADADFAILANEFEGVLNSRILARYTLPRTIVVLDDAGVARVDSTPLIFGGTVRLQVDTLADPTMPALIELYPTTEEWDRLSANWQLRIDSGGVTAPWSQPGGSIGPLISSMIYADPDSILLDVDSTTLAAWADTTNPARGALISVATSGARLRTGLPTLRVRARSTIQPDTVVEVTVAPARTFIFEPEQPDSVAQPRVGGTPAWRTVLRLRERLDTVSIPCPGEPGCTLRLGDLTINYAAMQLQPVASPDGFVPELPITPALHALLPSPLLPLQRSPLTGAFGFTTNAIAPERFRDPTTPLVELPATEFMRLMFSRPDTTGATFVPTHIALLPADIRRSFGFGVFAEMPTLRIIFTNARELQLP